VVKHLLHVESDTVIRDGDPESFQADCQLDRYTIRFGMLDDVAQGLLDDAEEEDFGSRKENLFVPGYGEVSLNMVLRFVRFEVDLERGNKLLLVGLQRTEIENHLTRFMNRNFELLLAFAQRRQAGIGIFADQFLRKFELKSYSGEALNKAVVHFAGNPSAFFSHRSPGFLDIEAIERLIFVQGLFNLGGRPYPRFNQFPHELGARAPEDRDAHAMEILKRLPHFGTAGNVDDEIDLLQFREKGGATVTGTLHQHGDANTRGVAM